MIIKYNQIMIYDLNKQHIFSRIQKFIGFVFSQIVFELTNWRFIMRSNKKGKISYNSQPIFLKNTDSSDIRLLCSVVMVTHVVI